MGDRELPADWDWVAARRQCSAAKIFELLALEAKKNVEALADPTDGRLRNRCEFVSKDAETFSIMRRERQSNATVRFYLIDDTIVVETATGDQVCKATLTLNNQGHCRLLVDGVELDRWQFLKRVLEPVLFAPLHV